MTNKLRKNNGKILFDRKFKNAEKVLNTFKFQLYHDLDNSKTKIHLNYSDDISFKLLFKEI